MAIVALPVVYLGFRAAASGMPALRILAHPGTLTTLANTIVLAATTVTLSIVLGVPLAWLTECTDLPGRRAWSVVLVLPLVIPSYVGAFLFAAALGPRGLLQSGLERAFDIERLPSIYGFPGALLVLTAVSYPYVLLTTRAALSRLDPSLLEAARDLGRSPVAAFVEVALPQLKPAILAGSLLVALYVIRDFGAVSIMRFDTFTRVIYTQYRAAIDRGGASALALLLIVVALTILAIERRARGEQNAGAATVRTPRRPTPIPLGRAQWPAVALCAGVALVSLGLPGAVLTWWLIRGMAEGVAVGSGIDIAAAAGRSLLAGGLAALVTVLAALPIAWVGARDRGRLGRTAEITGHVGYALPGVAVALAFTFFGARWAGSLYQTIWILIVAYVVLFLPLAADPVRVAMERVDPRLESAARGLGRGPLATFRAITLPLVAPGMGAGAALVFLSAVKELPATLILGPYGFSTLATLVWSRVSEAYFAEAALPALLLILLSSLPTAALMLRRT